MHEVRTDDIRTRPDGSIDTAHYMARGREARALQARHLARRLVGAIAAALGRRRGQPFSDSTRPAR